MSRYEICKRSGIDQSLLSRFMHDKASLSLASIERLTEVLNLQITVKENTRKKKR